MRGSWAFDDELVGTVGKAVEGGVREMGSAKANHRSSRLLVTTSWRDGDADDDA
ncbi:MAG: hypothetical protein R3B97_11105 [Dehalococcoidia bacterium]